MNKQTSAVANEIEMKYKYANPAIKDVMNIGMARVIVGKLDSKVHEVDTTMVVKRIINEINDVVMIDTSAVEREVTRFRRYYASMQSYAMSKYKFTSANDIFNHYDYFDKISLDNVDANLSIFNSIIYNTNRLLDSMVKEGLELPTISE